jgi:hypothetical protein
MPMEGISYETAPNVAGEDDPDVGDGQRQNRLDEWRPMLGADRPVMMDPAGGLGAPGVSGIIYADVDAAPLYSIVPLDENLSPQPENWRIAVPGTDTAAKKGDVALAYDISESDPSVYATLLDVDNVYPGAMQWVNTSWMPEVAGEPREPRAPLPIPANAGILGATTPGEVDALALRKVPRIWFTTWDEQAWQEYDIDGRHVIFPRQNYPIGDGPMVPQSISLSVNAVIPGAITSELGANTMVNGEDYSSMAGV